MRAIRPNFSSTVALLAAVAIWPQWLVRADEPMFAVIRVDPILLAQRADERESPRSMSVRGWSTRTSRFAGNGEATGRTSPATLTPKRAMAAQSAGRDVRPKRSAFDSSAAPLRRDLPKVLRDPPKTRRRPLGW